MDYFLTGEGANKPPYNLFIVDHNTGFVRITGIVDREEHPKFHVSHCVVLNKQQLVRMVFRVSS